jgi:hypothetical protein
MVTAGTGSIFEPDTYRIGSRNDKNYTETSEHRGLEKNKRTHVLVSSKNAGCGPLHIGLTADTELSSNDSDRSR